MRWRLDIYASQVTGHGKHHFSLCMARLSYNTLSKAQWVAFCNVILVCDATCIRVTSFYITFTLARPLCKSYKRALLTQHNYARNYRANIPFSMNENCSAIKYVCISQGNNISSNHPLLIVYRVQNPWILFVPCRKDFGTFTDWF